MITLDEAKKTLFSNEIEFEEDDKLAPTARIIELTDEEDTPLQSIVLSSDGKYILRFWHGDYGTTIVPINSENKLSALGAIVLVSRDMFDFDYIMERMTILTT